MLDTLPSYVCREKVDDFRFWPIATNLTRPDEVVPTSYCRGPFSKVGLGPKADVPVGSFDVRSWG